LSIELTIKAYVQAAGNKTWDHITQQIKGIIFLGTPHLGSNFTKLGLLAAQALRPLGSNAALLSEIKPDSDFLLDLHRDFVDRVHKDLHVFHFFERRPTRVLQLWFLPWEEIVSRPAWLTCWILTGYSACLRTQQHTAVSREEVLTSITLD
jgi:hypothetical protein